jgi:hypothetical protein
MQHRVPLSKPRRAGTLAVALLAVWAAPALHAAEERRPAGTSAGEDATIIRREAADKPWQVVKHGEQLFTGDLLVGMPGALIDSADGAVRLALLSDPDKQSPYPVLEAAVVLHKSEGHDLDFTLDRGRVNVTNRKKDGAAKVRVRFHDQSWEVALETPGAEVALQLYGRWAAGVRFNPKPGPQDVPTANLLLLAVKGEARVKHGTATHLMRAPPGPALLHWCNEVAGEAPERLEALPPWADAQRRDTEQARKARVVLDKFRKLMLEKSMPAALDEFLASDEPLERTLAVVCLGATDNLEGLRKVFQNPKQHEMWDTAVLVLRHWMGRGPEQDRKLFQGLTTVGKYTPAQAKTVMQLLHSFGEADLARPELYEMLVHYMGHDAFGVRGLAHWHLYRLVPEGRKINFDPLAPKEQREKARAQWKELVEEKIAAGELPRKPRPAAAQAPEKPTK